MPRIFISSISSISEVDVHMLTRNGCGQKDCHLFLPSLKGKREAGETGCDRQYKGQYKTKRTENSDCRSTSAVAECLLSFHKTHYLRTIGRLSMLSIHF